MDVPIEHCTSAKVFQKDAVRRTFLVALVVALYAAVLPYCYFTAGEPRRTAMLQAQRLADEKWALEVALLPNATSAAPVDRLLELPEVEVDGDGFVFEKEEIVFEFEKKAREREKRLAGALASSALQDEFDSASPDEDLSASAGPNKQQELEAAAATQSWLMSWFGPSKEQKRAAEELEQWQKEIREKSGKEEVSLPPEYLPSAGACLALFLTLSLHALFHLMCHWVVAFKAATLFKAAKKVDETCFVLIAPPANRGATQLVPVQKSSASSAIPGMLFAEFQRQKYIYSSPAKLGAEIAKKYPNGAFTLTAYPVALPLAHYLAHPGVSSETEAAKLTEKWGKNHLAVAIPSFFELLQAQLLSPLAIFQVFCAVLWLLDEYWSYTLFTLGSVVMYEATTVFQRTRTQQMLGGMSPKALPIYVFRAGRWQCLLTKDLLPGDLISLAFKKRAAPKPLVSPLAAPHTAQTGAQTNTQTQTQSESDTQGETTKNDLIPCDCVLVRGAAVVNEASLTGESVPQMKEALALALSADKHAPSHAQSKDKDEEKLDMHGVHRVHVLFSGCSLVTVSGSDNNKNTNSSSSTEDSSALLSSSVPSPPDHGAIAYVLRTGFGSSQGSLLQMIEFSQQSVSGDAKETGLALLMLFIFALMASGYVLKEGLRKKEKTTHELLLRCVIIITSVVPRQFPMQMAVAVNMALMTLSKAGILCTEPFRVPLAGKISHLLFDKTGTITTDQLVPVGLINYNSCNTSVGGEDDEGNDNNAAKTGASTVSVSSAGVVNPDVPSLTSVPTACAETAMILAACHSLVVVEEANSSSSANNNDEDEDNAKPAIGNNSTNFDPLAPAALPTSNLTGDPIELAAIRAIEWHWDAKTNTATPDGAWKRHTYALSLARAEFQKLSTTPLEQRPAAAQHAQAVEAAQKEIRILEQKLAQAQTKAQAALFSHIQVLARHHFSSALQRMSVVVKCHNRVLSHAAPLSSSSAGSNAQSSSSSAVRERAHSKEKEKERERETSSSSSGDHWYCLVKGSPEALKPLILPSSLPAWYSQTYEALARRGLRVLALAYKKVLGKDKPVEQPRQWVEKDLLFGGFIAFECKIRGDSSIVIQSLRESEHAVAMLTGDALLTSVHVAKQVGICDGDKKNYSLQCKVSLDAKKVSAEGEETEAAKKSASSLSLSDFYWQNLDDANDTLAFDYASVPALYAKHNLMTTELAFLGVVGLSGTQETHALHTASAHNASTGAVSLGDSPMWQCARYFKVFARMSPQGKAQVIKAIQDTDSDLHVLMCGDGGNDVGALKQADVGIALLSGHANANTSDELSATENANEKKNAVETKKAEDVLNEHQKKLQQRNEDLNKARAAHMKEFQARYTREQQAWLQEEMRLRTERGEYMAMFSLMKEQAAKVKQAMAEENQRFMAMHGQVWDAKRDGDASGTKTAMEQLFEAMDSADSAGGLAVVRPGDASVAAPFTSRIPSIRAVIDLIRQGRCTLLSALMQQQIMMLESCISAYTLSALSLHNARSSERQMMASSWLILTAAVSFSYASPVDHMHPLRPLRSLFHPAIICSILGQAAIHIGCMTLAVHWATDAMGPEKLQEVTEFFRKVKSNEIDRAAMCGEDDFLCQMQSYWMAPFLPNLLNSTVFLVETSQMISVFFANYKGRPWMKGMLENHPLFLSVFLCIAGVVVAAWEMVPQVNELIQLAPFPDDAYRYKVVFLVVCTILGTFAWDRLCVLLFAPKVFAATMGEVQKTTYKDFLPIVYTALKVLAGLFVLSTGNILLAGLAYYMYRNYNAKMAAQEQQARK